jgi:mono/diheme cytochrome c family protein
MVHVVWSLFLFALLPSPALQGQAPSPVVPAVPTAHQDAANKRAKVPAKNLAQAGALFRKACASCHFVPSDRDQTDVAWLGQVRETS